MICNITVRYVFIIPIVINMQFIRTNVETNHDEHACGMYYVDWEHLIQQIIYKLDVCNDLDIFINLQVLSYTRIIEWMALKYKIFQSKDL